MCPQSSGDQWDYLEIKYQEHLRQYLDQKHFQKYAAIQAILLFWTRTLDGMPLDKLNLVNLIFAQFSDLSGNLDQAHVDLFWIWLDGIVGYLPEEWRNELVVAFFDLLGEEPFDKISYDKLNAIAQKKGNEWILEMVDWR